MSLRHAVLGLLAEESASGYDLKRRFERSMQHVWAATQSQLYTELGRLADDELIRVSAEGARGRKAYAITQQGRDELRRWITAPQRTPIHNVDLLKTFMLAQVSPDEAHVVLSRLASDARGRRDQLLALRDEVAWDDSAGDHFGQIALEWGLRFADLQIGWVDWALSVDQRNGREDAVEPQR